MVQAKECHIEVASTERRSKHTHTAQTRPRQDFVVQLKLTNNQHFKAMQAHNAGGWELGLTLSAHFGCQLLSTSVEDTAVERRLL